MGQAAQESFAGRQGNHGLLGKAGLTGGISQGRAKYCGYTNDVMPGMWSGGVVGLKSILGVKRRTEALEIMNTLSRFGYIRYTLDEKTKKLEYVVTDWVVKCSGAECMSGAVYATDGYGFLCLPATSRSALRISIIHSANQMHGWTSGATRFGRRPAMRFPVWRLPFNSGDLAPL